MKIIDLFAGCGGLTQGFREFVDPETGDSPFRPVAAVEFDFAAACTYAANFSAWSGGVDHIFQGDIKAWETPEIPQADIVLGGPPCQGFSALNKGSWGNDNPDDDRNKLWVEYARVVKKAQPKVFVMENVDRFLKSEEFTAFRKQTEPGGEFDDYHIEAEILNSADFGVAQRRRRTIIIGTHRDLKPITHPSPTHDKNGEVPLSGTLFPQNNLPAWVPLRETIREGVAHTPLTTDLPDRWEKPLGDKFPKIQGMYATSELHIGRNPEPRSLERYRHIPPGGNRHDLPWELQTKGWRKHNNGSGDVMGRLEWGKPSVTIRTEFFKPEKGRYLHPSADRPLTHLEAALIQGFPRDFLWCGSKVQIARQIGNAVPIGLAREIAKHLFQELRLRG